MRIDVSVLLERWSLLRDLRAASSTSDTATQAAESTEAPVEAPDDPATADPEPRGFRSPATENAFRRLEDRLLTGIDGDRKARIEALLDEARTKAGAASADDARPYGRSVEHRLKQMLIHMVHDLKKHDAPPPPETDGDLAPAPVAPEPTVDAAADDAGSEVGTGAPYATGIDRIA
jgi:hypothetical protein